MVYGVKRIRIYDSVWSLWQISARLALPDPSDPSSEVVGFPQVEIVWQDSESHGTVPAESQAEFVQYVLDAIAQYPNLSNIVATSVKPSETPMTPTV